MIIRKQRIRSLASNLKGIRRGETVHVGLVNLSSFVEELERAGFSENRHTGETVLPTAFGPVSTYNAEGKFHKHTDQPKETAYRQAEWTWQEFNGPYDTVERSKIVDIPYERYPRTFMPPPSVELSVATSQDGSKVVVSPEYQFSEENDEIILHTINLFLEVFGECAILDSRFQAPIRARMRRLNWEVLPKGRLPWEQLKQSIEPIIKQQPRGNQPVIEERFKTISGHSPEFVAIGRAGFHGYLIFGFPDQGLYILESTQTNNATYVLREGWEAISTLTKAEILQDNLHERRIIHREYWFDEMRRLLRHN